MASQKDRKHFTIVSITENQNGLQYEQSSFCLISVSRTDISSFFSYSAFLTMHLDKRQLIFKLLYPPLAQIQSFQKCKHEHDC